MSTCTSTVSAGGSLTMPFIRSGMMRLDSSCWIAMYSSSTHSAVVGEMTSARISAGTALRIGPMYGMNSSNPANTPRASAAGIPSAQRPSVVSSPITSMPITVPSIHRRSVKPTSSSARCARGRPRRGTSEIRPRR